MKKYSLVEITNKFIGKPGEPNRDKFEYDLRTEVIGEMIKRARLEQHLTQEQFGVLLGVQKSQISKIENNAKDVRFSTILRAFEALKAQVHLTVEFPGKVEGKEVLEF